MYIYIKGFNDPNEVIFIDHYSDMRSSSLRFDPMEKILKCLYAHMQKPFEWDPSHKKKYDVIKRVEIELQNFNHETITRGYAIYTNENAFLERWKEDDQWIPPYAGWTFHWETQKNDEKTA